MRGGGMDGEGKVGQDGCGVRSGGGEGMEVRGGREEIGEQVKKGKTRRRWDGEGKTRKARGKEDEGSDGERALLGEVGEWIASQGRRRVNKL